MNVPFWKSLCWLLISIVFWFGNGALVFAQSVITDIDIRGTTELEAGQILFKLENQVGQPLDKRKVINDIKTIYQMGFFEDVQVEVEEQTNGYLLIFMVVERPRVQDIRFTGRSLIYEEDITEKIKTKEFEIYDPVKTKQDEKIIRDLYRAKGYSQVSVITNVEKLTDKQYIVDYVINETNRVYLTDINVTGSEVFSELDVRRFITSAEIDCTSWIDQAGVFQEERINQDLILITQNFLSEGYIKVFIDKPKVVLTKNPEYSEVEVSLNITDGAQYFTGKIDIVGDILQTKEELLEQLNLKEGDVYNPFLQNQDRAILNEIYQEQGYAFVRVRPRPQIDDERRIVDVTYEIVKNEKAYIGRVEFSGNHETRDFVIRREIEVKEGDLYNGRKLRSSQANLEQLSYFEAGLNFQRQPVEDEDNLLNFLLALKEARTGNFQGQIGFSDGTGISGGVSLTKGNLFGAGQTLRLSAQFAEKGVQNDFSVTFIEPRLFGSQISTSFSVSQQKIVSAVNSDSNRLQNSRAVSLGFPLIGKWRLSTRFSAVDRLFESDVPSVIKRSLAPSLVYNTVNHILFPSAGINTSFTVIQSGGNLLGGNTQSREYNFRYKQFWSLNEKRTFILMAHARLGLLEKIADSNIPNEDRYRIGGISTLRGHENSDVSGPYSGTDANPHRILRTITGEDGQALQDVIDTRTRHLTFEQIQKLESGGISQRLFNLEMVFPLSQGPTSNIRGVVFYDAGNVNAESIQYKLLDEKEPGFFELRHSIGGGIRMITPLGVLRFEYGQKLDQREGETPDKFDFTISGLF